MGWFSRKPSPSDDQRRQAADEPFVVDDRIVARVSELMTAWNDAVGNDARMRAVASGISSAAGLDDLQQAVLNPGLIQRPWKMLAAVVHLATESGDDLLAGRIFGFVSFWSTQIAPHLLPADWFDMRLDKIPPAIEVDIASTALQALRQLWNDQTIFSNASGTLGSGNLIILAANVIVHAPEKGVPVDEATLAMARGILGRR